MIKLNFSLLANKNFKLELMETFRFMKTRVFHNKRSDKKTASPGWKLQIQEKKKTDAKMSATKFNSQSEGLIK